MIAPEPAHDLFPSDPWPGLAAHPARVHPIGLINTTIVVGDPPVAVVQRVHPVFRAEVHDDIEAITTALEVAGGLVTPRLLRTRTGALCHVDEQGRVWRAMTFVEGETVERVEDPRRAYEAGRLVARWHRALDGVEHRFAFTRPGAHDTPAHVRKIDEVLRAAPEHRLAAEVAGAGAEVAQRWTAWRGRLDLPRRICHGDLKISNLLFASSGGEGLCLLDLDTMAWDGIDLDLGDACRSWCNRTAENGVDVTFDAEIFESSLRGYVSERALDAETRAVLVSAVERICLELSARFLADAIEERYFRWDARVAPAAGEHNLIRGRGQLALARSVAAQRSELERLLVAI